MSSRIGASVVAGLIAGIVFGMMMQMMMAPTPEGGEMPMRMVAMGSLVGHLIFGAILGSVFLWMHHRAVHPAAG